MHQALDRPQGLVPGDVARDRRPQLGRQLTPVLPRALVWLAGRRGLVAGAVGYNMFSPPNHGRIDIEHAMWAGVVGAVCGTLGGALDLLLGGDKRRRESRVATVILDHVGPRRDGLDATLPLRPRRAETATRPVDSTPDLTLAGRSGRVPRR